MDLNKKFIEVGEDEYPITTDAPTGGDGDKGGGAADDDGAADDNGGTGGDDGDDDGDISLDFSTDDADDAGKDANKDKGKGASSFDFEAFGKELGIEGVKDADTFKAKIAELTKGADKPQEPISYYKNQLDNDTRVKYDQLENAQKYFEQHDPDNEEQNRHIIAWDLQRDWGDKPPKVVLGDDGKIDKVKLAAYIDGEFPNEGALKRQANMIKRTELRTVKDEIGDILQTVQKQEAQYKKEVSEAAKGFDKLLGAVKLDERTKQRVAEMMTSEQVSLSVPKEIAKLISPAVVGVKGAYETALLLSLLNNPSSKQKLLGAIGNDVVKKRWLKANNSDGAPKLPKSNGGGGGGGKGVRPIQERVKEI